MQPQQDEMWIEVLEWMGWQWWRFPDRHGVKIYAITGPQESDKWQPRQGGVKCSRPEAWREESTGNIPPLTLDTLHEAEAKLDAEQQVQYASFLHELYRGQRHYLHIDFDVLHTGKEQRLLALWRAIKQCQPDEPAAQS